MASAIQVRMNSRGKKYKYQYKENITYTLSIKSYNHFRKTATCRKKFMPCTVPRGEYALREQR